MTPEGPSPTQFTVHELSIVEALIEQVERELERSGRGARVVRLNLEIGRLSGVCPDSLRFAWELVSPETPLAGAELCIAEPPAVCACGQCGARTELDDLAFTCPKCGSTEVTIEGGQQMLLQTIELEDSM